MEYNFIIWIWNTFTFIFVFCKSKNSSTKGLISYDRDDDIHLSPSINELLLQTNILSGVVGMYKFNELYI